MTLLKIKLLFLTCTILFFSYSQTDYLEYFRKSYELKYKLFIGDTSAFINGFDSIIQLNDSYPDDYYELGKVFYQKDKNKSLEFFKKAINYGYDLETMVYFFDKLSMDKKMLTVLQNEQKNFNKTIDTFYSKSLNEMAELDQKVRIEKIHSSEEEHYKYVNEIDRQNLNKLKFLIDSLGWSSYKKVGRNSSRNAFLIMLHSLRQFKTDSDMIIYFKNLLLNEIKMGNFSPSVYANLFDDIYLYQNELQIFGTLADPDNYLLPSVEFGLIDKNRYDIGLNPLNQYLKTAYIRLK